MGNHPERAEPSAHTNVHGWFSSRDDVLDALGKSPIAFPVLVAPAGAEHDESVLCRVVRSASELTEDLVSFILEHAYPIAGIPCFQLISLGQDSPFLKLIGSKPFSLAG